MCQEADTVEQQAADEIDLTALEPVLEQFPRRPDQLMPALRAVQDMYGYVPPPVLRPLAKYLGISWAKVYGVASFYAHFHLTPRGRHTVRVCRGTACHVRGSKRILEAVKEELAIDEGKTTPDLNFSLETVACLGTCSLAPVIMVDDQYYGRLSPDRIKTILSLYGEAPAQPVPGGNSQ